MSASRFLSIDENTASKLAQQFGSPLFIVDEPGVLSRFHSFQLLAKQAYARSRVAISYKTNPLQSLLYRFHQLGGLAEVVSGVEYQMARRLGVNATNIIFNGPMKTDEELRCAIKEGAYINCDHLGEVERIEAIAQTLGIKVNVGIRLCFSDIGKGWNRFGFELNNNHDNDIIKRIINSRYLSLAGLHSHIGTNIRDIFQYKLLATKLNQIAWDLKVHFSILLKWIDVGGGLAGISPRRDELMNGPHPLPNLSDYVANIVTPLKPYLDFSNAELLFEPGRTVFEPYAALLTQVVGQRPEDKNGTAGFIFDAGCNIMSTAYVYNHPIYCPKQSDKKSLTYLYGPTCNQVDQLHEPALLPQLSRGDFVLFYGVGAYCMSFSYSFIRYRPGVIIWHEGGSAAWLRKAETLEYVSQLECIPNVEAV